MTMEIWQPKTYRVQQKYLKGKFTGIYSYLKKQEKSQIYSLTLIPTVTKEEQNPIKLCRKINHKGQSRNKSNRNEEQQISMKLKVGSLRRKTKLRNL